MATTEPDRWFAENLRRERDRIGMPQHLLAERLARSLGRPYSQQTIAQIENGTRKVSIGEAQELARAVGSDAGTLARAPEQAEVVLRILRLARELREFHGQAQNFTHLFLADREGLRQALDDAAGTDGIADAVAEGREAAGLRLHWEG